MAECRRVCPHFVASSAARASRRHIEIDEIADHKVVDAGVARVERRVTRRAHSDQGRGLELRHKPARPGERCCRILARAQHENWSGADGMERSRRLRGHRPQRAGETVVHNRPADSRSCLRYGLTIGRVPPMSPTWLRKSRRERTGSPSLGVTNSWAEAIPGTR